MTWSIIGKKISLLLLGGFFLVSSLSAETISLNVLSPDRLTISEIRDVRRYINNQYEGFLFNQTKIILHNSGTSNLPQYSGQVFYYEELKRDNKLLPKQIDSIYEIDCVPQNSAYISYSSISPFPRLQNVPYFTNDTLEIGDKWQSYGIMIVDPKRNGVYTRLKTLTEYEFKGITEYIGKEAILIQAQFASRYSQGDDPLGDQNLYRVSGSHRLTIYLFTDSSQGYFFRDSFEEEFQYRDGSSVLEKGFILHWANSIVSLDRSTIVKQLEESSEDLGSDDLNIKEDDYGISFSLDSINFYPDSDEFLPNQEEKIIKVFEILQSVNNRSILVVGHTANIGSVESQVDLSVLRAKKVVEVLSALGFPADQLLYRGVGGSQPIASNDTEDGRAKNRRVEFIILED